MLSKLDVIDSVAASISLGDMEQYEINTLSHILKRYDNVYEYLSTCRQLLANVIHIKSTNISLES